MIVLINPNLVVLRRDPFTTGIVYMPIGLAYVAASLRHAGMAITVIDAFAEAPHQARLDGKFMYLGLSGEQILQRLPANTKAVVVYAINATNHLSTAAIVNTLKRTSSDVPVIVLENSQAVTACAIRETAAEFYRAGANYVLSGDAEERAVDLARILLKDEGAKTLDEVDGLGSPAFFHEPKDVMQDLDSLPFPAWDLFPLENYWKLRYAHAPQTTRKCMPLLTSRGCPFACRFCVIPATNHRKWRSRTARNVVDEMELYRSKYGVTEFHIEDLNPTVSDSRIRELCDELSRRQLNVTWKLGAGTKVETIRSEETIDLMSKAGCRYISISPETGSPRVLQLMDKPFDLQHAIRLVKRMKQAGIRSQACFVLGFPGEEDEDRKMTWSMVRELTRIGLDEIALFIIAPIPGAHIFGELRGYESLSDLNFTPTWRRDYVELSRFRLHLYIHFLFWKLRYHPMTLLRQMTNFLTRRFETKMEMVPYRALCMMWIGLTESLTLVFKASWRNLRGIVVTQY